LHHRGLYRPTLPLTGNVPVSHVRHRRHNNKPATYRPTYRERFRDSYLTESNWINGGSVLTEEDLGDPVVTSLVVGDKYTVVGMANSKICVYSSTTGRFIRDFEGHDLGVWALVLVTPKKAGSRRAVGGDDPSPTGARSSDICGTAQGWDKRTLLVSGGCDRNVYVWDMAADPTDPNRRHPWEFALRGHSSTVRCIKVLDGRPIAVSGSRDYTLRVWDIEKGRMLRVLDGHEQSVRCIEVVGNQVVSGSYDYTCRLWDIDTGECLQVFEGHYHQIYAVAFDGHRVISGSLDSTVRVWDAMTGECTAILQGHTSLVGQLQLDGDRLVTGGSDGRVIVFDLNDFSCVHRLCAHDNSVTCLQFDDRYIVSGGNDGCVKLWDVETGHTVRQLTRPCDAVWRVAFRNDKCVILCQRKGRTMLEVIGFRPEHGA
jgi:F-box and WD-40 domain protein CDC4